MAAVLGVAAAWPGGPELLAQVSRNGPEFQVNTYTEFNQYLPDVGVSENGGFVVAWQSRGEATARRFDAFGQPLGSDFRVASYTPGYEESPALVVHPAGDFIVAWSSYGSNGADDDGTSIRARRFGADGAPLGDDFQVNSYSTGYQWGSSAAGDAAGDFVVVWVSPGSSGGDNDGSSIQGQRFDSAGSPLGSEFQVNSYVTGNAYDPSVASDPMGNFVVVWSNYDDLLPGGTYRLRAQRFDSTGLPAGSDFEILRGTLTAVIGSSVGMDAGGGFVVTWSNHVDSGLDIDATSIHAQRFDSMGTPLAPSFLVNTVTTAWQSNPSIQVAPNGEFTIAWASYSSAGSDSSPYSIQARRFDADGDPLGDDFQVNTYTTDVQFLPAVAADGDGNFVITWQSFGSAGTDTSGWSVQAQRFDALFRDGFESGDTGRWSAALP